jgi:hypothetical protein
LLTRWFWLTFYLDAAVNWKVKTVCNVRSKT